MRLRLDVIHPANLACTACALRDRCNTVVTGIGPADTRIIIVGEAPGEDEDLEGKPFVGRSGTLLTKILTDAGIDRESVYITNMVKCRPPKNRKPLQNEIDTCKIWLWREIQTLNNTKVIVTLGSISSGTLLKMKNIVMKHVIGQQIEVEYTSAKIMPWYHPSYLLRNNNMELNNKTVEFFKKVKELTNV